MTEITTQKYHFNATEKRNYTRKRKNNISAFVNMIKSATTNNPNLSYANERNLIELYKTNSNEAICILFPGRESSFDNTKPYDFKPLILKPNRLYIRDMAFSHIIDSLAQINDNSLLEALALVLFRISRLSLHSNNDDITYQYTETIPFNNIRTNLFKCSSAGNISGLSCNWHKLKLHHSNNELDIATQNAITHIMSTNQKIHIINDDGSMEENQSFSIEAFLYFLDLLMLNEDIKYNYNSENDTIHLSPKGRQRTNDLLLGYVLVKLTKIKPSYFIHKISVGRGVVSLTYQDYIKIPGIEF